MGSLAKQAKSLDLVQMVVRMLSVCEAMITECFEKRKGPDDFMDIGISILVYITCVYLYCLQLLLVTLNSAFMRFDHFKIIE